MSNGWLVTWRVILQTAAAGCIGAIGNMHDWKFWVALVAMPMACWASQEMGERIGILKGRAAAWKAMKR